MDEQERRGRERRQVGEGGNECGRERAETVFEELAIQMDLGRFLLGCRLMTGNVEKKTNPFMEFD